LTLKLAHLEQMCYTRPNKKYGGIANGTASELIKNRVHKTIFNRRNLRKTIVLYEMA